MTRTKIVATIGPASQKQNILEQMIRAGMTAARLNFSHGTHADHARLLRKIRAAARRTGAFVPVIADLQGPKLRVGELPASGLALKKGNIVSICSGRTAPASAIPVVYPNFSKDVKAGSHILFSDGAIEVVVTGVSGSAVRARVMIPGTLKSHKGFMVPGGNLRVASLTPKDRDDLKFIRTIGVEYVALSFVRSAEDVHGLRRLLPRKDAPKIISKIETKAAVDRFEEILDASDAIMVARGDLALEASAAAVPVYQKTMIRKSLAAGKPVIVATQMLGSMVASPRPTRAEVSDVANAVIDHTDAVMLSDETAVGEYPVETVRTMAEIAAETEKSSFDDLSFGVPGRGLRTSTEAIGESVGVLSRTARVAAIVATTITGETARRLAQFRPELSLYVGTPDESVARQINLSWGVRPFRIPRVRGSAEQLAHAALADLRRKKTLRRGEQVILVTGEPGKRGGTNRLSLVAV